MAPEQFLFPKPDHRADQFAFAVVAFEALYGFRPFGGRTPLTLFQNIRAQAIECRPGQPRIPTRVRRALLRGLALSPSKRHPDLDHLLRALAAASARNRRLAFVTACLLSLAVAMGAWTWRASSQRLERCADGARALAKAMQKNLNDPHLVYAAVARIIQSYGQKWQSVYEEACLQARVHGERSEAAFEVQNTCLQRGLLHLSALVETLPTLEPEQADRAARAASRLPAPQLCNKLDVQRDRRTAPAAEQTKTAAQQISRDLAEATVLGDLGLAQRGLEAASRGQRAAAQQGLAVELGEALYAVGVLHQSAGDPEAAEAALRAAWRQAEATGQVQLRAMAGLELFKGAPLEASEDHRQRLYQQADAAIERAGNSPLLRAEILAAAARKKRDVGAFKDASELLKKASELLVQVYGPVHPRIAQSLQDLGVALREGGELHDALAALSRAAEIESAMLSGEAATSRHPEATPD